jgi:hypothetical protein
MEETKQTMKEQEEFADAIVCVSDLELKKGTIQAAIAAVPESDKTCGTKVALDVALKTVPLFKAFTEEEIYVGLIKETENYGNTSVSMGKARLFFDQQADAVENGDKNQEDMKSFVGFLNCGTGGPKFQTYSETPNDILYCVREEKPEEGFSVNDLPCGPYVPKTKTPATVEALNSMFLDLTSTARTEKRPIEAFITGPMRECYEKQTDAKVKEDMLTVVRQVFKGITDHVSFLPQDDEAECEMIAVKEMYDNLCQESLIDENYTVVGSFGIGRGSTQLTIASPHSNLKVVMKFNFGMTDLPKLKTLPQEVVEALKQHGDTLQKIFDECEDEGEFPIIAFKSGAALLSMDEKFPEVRNALLAPVLAELRTEVPVLSGTDGTCENGENETCEAQEVEQNDAESTQQLQLIESEMREYQPTNAEASETCQLHVDTA